MKVEAMKSVECSCNTCQSMCRRPCWPTPSEAQAMIDDGLGSKLMLDYWFGGGRNGDILLVTPADKGSENGQSPWFDFKGCVLQDEQGLCTIHNSGYKPLEGRLASCGDRPRDNRLLRHWGRIRDITRSISLLRRWKSRKPKGINVHKAVAELWNTDEGEQVAKGWMQDYMD